MNAANAFFLLFTIGLVSGQNIYTKMEDSFSEHRRGNQEARIRVPKGNKIILYLDEITLEAGSKLTIRDGADGDAFVFKKIGSSIFKAPENDENNLSPVNVSKEAAWKFETKTRKLTISYETSRTGEGYSAHYIAYSDTGCQKSHLNDVVEADILRTECDTVDDVPKATQCEVTANCGDSYQQSGKTMTCSYGEWSGDIACKPIEEKVQRCTYDFDEFTVNSDCPYQASELARYYLEDADLSDFDVSIGRSQGQRITFNCGRICAIKASGARAIKCGNRRRKRRRSNLFIKCLYCRVVNRCEKGVIII